jgi:DNA-binding MarR family transcriptional regulator/GNAT superfamily N-acetyltransferase
MDELAAKDLASTDDDEALDTGTMSDRTPADAAARDTAARDAAGDVAARDAAGDVAARDTAARDAVRDTADRDAAARDAAARDAAARDAAAKNTVGDAAVAAVRGFNRFYTNLIGLLRGKYLDTPYSLTEGRILFELGQRDASEVADLRRTVDIDAGYLSRILGRFESDGLITRQRSATDGRRQVIWLTDGGRSLVGSLDARSAAQTREMLAAVRDDDRRRLLDAMRVITEVLSESPRPRGYLLRAPQAGDMGWVVQRHGALYAEEYGFDETFEALVARLVADYVDNRDPDREAAWIAEVDGTPAGCVFCVRKDDSTAQLRMLLVESWARGLGIGSRLVEEVLRFARRAGYSDITLWTNDVLADARRVYQRAGFTLDDEAGHHSFGKDLVEQNWSRRL